MIKLDIVNAVVGRTGVTRTKAEHAVETVFEALKSALGRGQRIELRRFGVFTVKPRKTGIGRNPRTGQKSISRRVKQYASSPARNCNPSDFRAGCACSPVRETYAPRRPQPRLSLRVRVVLCNPLRTGCGLYLQPAANTMTTDNGDRPILPEPWTSTAQPEVSSCPPYEAVSLAAATAAVAPLSAQSLSDSSS